MLAKRSPSPAAPRWWGPETHHPARGRTGCEAEKCRDDGVRAERVSRAQSVTNIFSSIQFLKYEGGTAFKSMLLPRSPQTQPRQMLDNSPLFTTPAPREVRRTSSLRFQRGDGTTRATGSRRHRFAVSRPSSLHFAPFRFHGLRLSPLGPTLVPQAPRSLDVRARKPCAGPLFNLLGSGEKRLKSTGPTRMLNTLEVEEEL